MTDPLNLFLGCLLATAILASSFAARRMWRRGKPMPQLLCARCLQPHDPVCETPADREFKARLLEALESNARLRSGSFSRSASTAAPLTAVDIAPSTTSGTGGSPGPGSDAREPAIQHNPGSGRIDASSRKQFGMCDYPD